MLVFWEFGGDEESRTPDPLLARQVLSQLSYTPTFFLYRLTSGLPKSEFYELFGIKEQLRSVSLFVACNKKR